MIDTAFHEEHRQFFVTLAKKLILVTTISDKNVPTTISRYQIISRYPDGVPVAHGTVLVKVGNKKIHTITDDRGVAVVEFIHTNEKTISVKVSKSGATAKAQIPLSGSAGLKTISDRAKYKVGDVAKFTIPYKGDTFIGNVYYDAIANGFVVMEGTARHDATRGGDYRFKFNISVSQSMEPFCEVRVYKIEKNLTVIKDSLKVSVSPSDILHVDVQLTKTVYRHGRTLK